MKGGGLLRFLGARVRVAFLAGGFLFLWAVAQFFHRDTGFSSLLSIGELLSDSKVTALKGVPHHVYEGSPGYDGAYYVQLALHPTLDNPELKKSIDNLPYRAKRILMSWTSWLLGLGRPAWIVQAHALLNVGCWLALAFLLLRWFPPDRWGNFLRWAGVMFSHGVIMSVRHALVDGPSLLLVALALRWLEDGRRIRGAVTLGLAGLGKETSLLAAGGTDFDWRRPGSWLRPALTVAAVALPLAAWMAFIRWKFGPAEDPGMGNFTWPLAGFAEKVGAIGRDLRSDPGFSLYWAVAATMLALAVQWAFFALRWRPAERWWRVGMAFAAMTTFLSTPVWEGYPGAATRVLLPMTLAFNVLVPRGWKWLPVLIAGNLTVATSIFEFSPPHEFHRVHGPAAEAVRVAQVKGWHGPERHLDERWRWTAGRAEVTLVNGGAAPVSVAVRGTINVVAGGRTVRVLQGERLLWGERIEQGTRELRFGLTLAPGPTTLRFVTEEPARKVGTDPRELAFRVSNLDIVVQPAAAPR
jgi:hypothetical protein